jgi:DNA-binding NarL/FixJ family response regulator
MGSTTVTEQGVNRTVPIDIVLVGGQPSFREGLQKLLEREPGFRVVGDASDADQAFKAIGDARPDIVIVSLLGRLLAHSRVMQTLQNLAAGGSHARTILLTTTMEATDIVLARELGVSGIVLKDASPRVLFDSVRSVAAGHCWLVQEPLDDLAQGMRHLSAIREKGFGPTKRGQEMDAVKCRLSSVFTEIVNRLQLAVFTENRQLTRVAWDSAPISADGRGRTRVRLASRPGL